MKVLHYVDENRLAWGEAWIQLLLELGRQGVQNFVVCKSGGTLAGRLDEEGISHDTCDIPFAQLPFTALKLGRLIDDFSPDLIHTRLSSAARTGGYWGKKKNVPVVESVDKYPKAHYHKNADFLLPCSTSVEDYMCSLGFPHEKMRVLHNPLDIKRYEFDYAKRAAMRAELGIAENQFVIIGAGRFVDWKGFDSLLEAYAAFLREDACMREASHLLLVGDGEEREKLLQLIDRLEIRENVLLPGFVSDIRPYLWASDLFVLPSKSPEPFGIILLEAMAAGLPCIATRAGGPLDMIEDGVSGWFVDCGNDVQLSDKIRELSANKNLRSTMAAAAAQRASSFDTSVIAATVVDIYRDMISKK